MSTSKSPTRMSPLQKKTALIQGVTNLLRDVLGKNPATMVAVIDEVQTDNWGIDGETFAPRRKHGR